MNKKAGLTTSVIILAVALVVGIFLGFRMSDNSEQIVGLQQENDELRLQVEDLQSQVDEFEMKRLGECKDSFITRYENSELVGEVILVVFNNEMLSEDIDNFAAEHDLRVIDWYSSFLATGATFSIPEGSDIFEQMCIVKDDSRVKSVEPNILVGFV